MVIRKSSPIRDPAFVLRETCCSHKSLFLVSESWPSIAVRSRGKPVLGNKPARGPQLSHMRAEMAGG